MLAVVVVAAFLVCYVVMAWSRFPLWSAWGAPDFSLIMGFCPVLLAFPVLLGLPSSSEMGYIWFGLLVLLLWSEILQAVSAFFHPFMDYCLLLVYFSWSFLKELSGFLYALSKSWKIGIVHAWSKNWETGKRVPEEARAIITNKVFPLSCRTHCFVDQRGIP